MRFSLTAMIVVMLTLAAHAGGNPDARVYIDFDPPDYVHEITPVPGEMIDAYVCIDQLGEGLTSVSLRFDDPLVAFPGVFGSAAWEPLLPLSEPPQSAPWDGYGIYVGSNECTQGDPVLLGVIHLGYLGGSCCLEILEHELLPSWVVDCSNERELDHFCVLSHGGIGGASCPPGDCGQSPVLEPTWGAVKGLYR